MQTRDLLSYSQWFTDEDQTLLWYAGRGLAHLHLYSPNVLGSNYNSVFETIPGTVLHLLGVTWRLAIPLGVAAIVLLCWGVVAAASWWRGHRGSAMIALAIPVCLALPYMLLADQTRGVLTGDLLAALAIATAVAVRRPWLRIGLMIAFAGIGFVWDNGSLIASVPALVAAVAADHRALSSARTRTARAIGCGALFPVALLVFDHVWYADHPGYVVSPPVPLSASLSVLWRHLEHPGALFGFYAPELLRLGGWIALVGLLAVVLAAIVVARSRRRIEPLAAAVSFMLILCGTLAVKDTGWNFSADLYLNGARFLLMMPLGAWVVLHYTLAACREGRAREHGHAPRVRGLLLPDSMYLAVAAVALASAATAQLSFGAQVNPLIAAGNAARAGVQIESSQSLLDQCAAVTPIYRAQHAQVLVSLDQPFAYGCAAQTGIPTLFPPYDRRPWLVEQAFRRPVRRILLYGGINCQIPPLKPGVGNCTPLAAGAELLVTPRRTLAQTLAGMGHPVYRPLRHGRPAA